MSNQSYVAALRGIACGIVINSFAVTVVNGAETGSTSSASITNELLAYAIHANAPSVLFEKPNNRWPGGEYSLKILKEGRPAIQSSHDAVQISLPVRVNIEGVVASELLQIKTRCRSSFQTPAQVKLTRAPASSEYRVISDVTVSIPPTQADCNGVTLPIDGVLRALVATQEIQWEKKIDSEIHAWMQQANDKAKGSP